MLHALSASRGFDQRYGARFVVQRRSLIENHPDLGLR